MKTIVLLLNYNICSLIVYSIYSPGVWVNIQKPFLNMLNVLLQKFLKANKAKLIATRKLA
jgi:hypothetical protein